MVALIAPPSVFFHSCEMALTISSPSPAFFYFQATGLLDRRTKKIVYVAAFGFLCLFFVTIAVGPKPIFDLVNSIIVIVSLIALVALSLKKQSTDRDLSFCGAAFLVFVVFALVTNVANILGYFPQVEALGFAFLLGTLGYVAARRTLHRDQELAQIQKELDVARRIQMENLPSAYPNSTKFHVAARHVPMTSVAGDLYDFIVADTHKAGLLIADVSGHGVPAALIASMVKLAASLQRANAANPAALLAGMNAALCATRRSNLSRQPTSTSMLNPKKLHYFRGCASTSLTATRRQSDRNYRKRPHVGRLSLCHLHHCSSYAQPGDRIVLYTDGIFEATDDKMENLASLAYRHCSVKARIFHRRRWPTASSQQSRPGQSPRTTTSPCSYVHIWALRANRETIIQAIVLTD